MWDSLCLSAASLSFARSAPYKLFCMSASKTRQGSAYGPPGEVNNDVDSDVDEPTDAQDSVDLGILGNTRENQGREAVRGGCDTLGMGKRSSEPTKYMVNSVCSGDNRFDNGGGSRTAHSELYSKLKYAAWVPARTLEMLYSYLIWKDVGEIENQMLHIFNLSSDVFPQVLELHEEYRRAVPLGNPQGHDSNRGVRYKAENSLSTRLSSDVRLENRGYDRTFTRENDRGECAYGNPLLDEQRIRSSNGNSDYDRNSIRGRREWNGTQKPV